MAAKRFWTEAEDRLLLAVTSTQVAKAMLDGRTTEAIYARRKYLRRYGIPRAYTPDTQPCPQLWTEAEDKHILDNWGAPYALLGKLLPTRARSAISTREAKLAAIHGLRRLGRNPSIAKAAAAGRPHKPTPPKPAQPVRSGNAAPIPGTVFVSLSGIRAEVDQRGISIAHIPSLTAAHPPPGSPR